jgi:hypothetical protein
MMPNNNMATVGFSWLCSSELVLLVEEEEGEDVQMDNSSSYFLHFSVIAVAFVDE